MSLWFSACTTTQSDNADAITGFGAIANDDVSDTDAIQKAMDACFEKGGGTVLIPPGKFISGSLALRNKVSLYLESGAVLQASSSLDDYEGEQHSFMTGEGLKNISISGQGVIDGAGQVFWDENYKALERPEPWIRLSNCSNLTVEGLLFRNSPSHTIRLEKSENVKFKGISIINPFRGPNTDGIDVVDSRNVIISDSYISTGDDAICLKSQRDTVESVVVTNCILESDDAAIKFGTGSHVATRFCSFSNTVIRKTRYGISLFMLDGGVFEHNSFNNLVIENGSRHAHEYPIFIDIDKRIPERDYGTVRDNTFSNIKMVTDGKILISGHTESHIKDLIFENITFYASTEADFSQAKKPRGNKNYPNLSTSLDLASKPAYFTLGYTDNLLFRNVTLYKAPESNRETFFTEGMTAFEKINFKIIDGAWE